MTTEINELSKKTLGSYIRKAHMDAVTRSNHRSQDVADHRDSGYNSPRIKQRIATADRKIDNRETGTTRAVKRLTKESNMLSFKQFVNEELETEQNFITEMCIELVGGEENYGTLDELSRKTLSSYIIKASDKLGHKEYYNGVGAHRGDFETSHAGAAGVKYGKRLKREIVNKYSGINSAAKKLAKEDFDAILKMVEDSTELNELSKKTLGSYIVKASDKLGHKEYYNGIGAHRGDFEINHAGAAGVKYGKRLKREIVNKYSGIRNATKRLTKESTELRAPVSASIEPYKDAHSLHDKAEQHRQIAKQAEHRYFNGGDEVDRVIYHAHMAKHHQLMGEHAHHTDSPEAVKAHEKSVSKNARAIRAAVETNFKKWTE